MFVFEKFYLIFGVQREEEEEEEEEETLNCRESSLLFFTQNTHMIKHTFLFLSF